MSIIHEAMRGAGWLALFRSISQGFSWGATIVVARLLTPEDYGLMEMATILTGYVVIFSELGLGAAIIQREKISDKELSSLFWFVSSWGLLLGILCIFLAYPTVAIFDEPRIFPITQAAGILFVIGGLLIVPRNLLHRQFRFEIIGAVDAAAIIISCLAMIFMASFGAGVWALIGGHIIREACKLALTYFFVSWRPFFHFKIDKIKPFIKFGINVAAGNSLQYVYTKSDRFFGGRAHGPHMLGHYSLALELANIPTDRLVSMINSASFPFFSKYQERKEEFNEFFLQLIKVIAFFTFPLFTGGFFIADTLIPAVLGQHWTPAILPFKYLCIAQLVVSITATNSIVVNAKGLPHWNLYLNFVNFCIFPASFYFFSRYGINYLVVPWVALMPLVRLSFTNITLNLLGIRKSQYAAIFFHPVIGSATMLSILTLIESFRNYWDSFLLDNLILYNVFMIFIGAATYAGYIFIFNRRLLGTFAKIRKSRV